jgi:hypothetical protein
MPETAGLGTAHTHLATTGDLDQEIVDAEFAAIVAANWPSATTTATRTSRGLLEPPRPWSWRSPAIQHRPQVPCRAARDIRPRPRPPPNENNRSSPSVRGR